MSSNTRKIVFFSAVLAMETAALAQKTSVRLPADNSFSQLKSGAGQDVVRKECSFCHSTDYIVLQPRMPAPQWDAEVKKMIGVYGAPISAADAKTIADYLADQYGAQASESKKAETSKP